MADAPPKPTNPFAKLAALRDALPPGAARTPDASEPASNDPLAAMLSRRTVVRRERKGHGGKTVTRVQFPDGGDEAALDGLAREIRKALGTGAQRDGDAITVHGDIVDRVADWLGARGAARIVRG